MKGEKRCVILGGGGHGRVVIDCLQASGQAIPYAVLDGDRRRWGQQLLGVPILGGDELLPELVSRGANCFVIGVGSIGNTRTRECLDELGRACRLESLTLIHPAAVCSQWAVIGRGAQLLPGCIVNAGATLGVNTIVNSGAIVEHDCVLGDYAHVATGASLASSVEVRARAHIGAGASIRQGIIIGEGALVGVGAVVVKDVPPHTVVVGVPARILRQLAAPR